MPSLSVVQTEPSSRRKDAPALSSPPESERAVKQAVDKPFEADRHFHQAAAQAGGHEIDHAAADHGFADRGPPRPARPVPEQVVDRHRQIMIGRQQAAGFGDDPMPVMIGVAGEGNVKAILDADQALHRVGRRRIHADPAVPIDRHEAEGRVDAVADHRQIDAVAFGDARPVVDPGAARAGRRPCGCRRRESLPYRSHCPGHRRMRRENHADGSLRRAELFRTASCALRPSALPAGYWPGLQSSG